jgi:isopenicillin N synthase-like dioxygenase
MHDLLAEWRVVLSSVQVPASPLEGAITVNIGDILMRWSDDTLKSTYHRVRVPEKVRC